MFGGVEMTEHPKERKPRTPKAKLPQASQDMADALVQFVNVPLTVLKPEWALEASECQALSNALVDAAQSNPFINAILVNLTSVGGVGEVVTVSAAIVARRYLKSIPVAEGQKPDIRVTMIDAATRTVIQSVATRTARPTGRKYRQRQNDASEGTVETPELRDYPGDETGRNEISGLQDGDDGIENPRRGRKRKVRAEAEI